MDNVGAYFLLSILIIFGILRSVIDFFFFLIMRSMIDFLNYEKHEIIMFVDYENNVYINQTS